ncbi:MAG TPA: 4-hydroxy-tetrahydrodipicolinate reductase [Candidatus Baltobacteraceae bacterium]|nr:4-hydroxy-tetrahydrodipicolinate reductase [Candidatus Baltobacteraceae bacterium]
MLRVAVAGALGKMGRVARTALLQASGVTYVGGFARSRAPADEIVDSLEELFERKPDVLLDLTAHPSSVEISLQAIAHGVRPVIGVSGWTADERASLDAMARERGLGAMIVPNFSIGAILMMRFAEMAARHFPSAEIIELHHDQKKDAPSGTSRATAERIVAAGGPATVPIHSVRMRGMLAHQEVLFGTDGEVLTIRHDSLSRESFVPGMIAAVKAVMDVRGLQIGLSLDFAPDGATLGMTKK